MANANGKRKADEPLDLESLPDWVNNPEYVSSADLKQYRNLSGVRKVMGEKYPGGWTDEHLEEYIVENRRGRIERTLALREEERANEEMVEVRIKMIIDELLKNFIDPTPNDLVNLREMARIQLTLDMLSEKQDKMAAMESIPAKDWEILSKVRKEALTSFRDLEKSLGIDRAARSGETDIVTTIGEVRRQARALIERRARKIICHNCEQDGIKINYGFVLFHPDMNGVKFYFQTTCPKCGNKIFLSTGENIP